MERQVCSPRITEETLKAFSAGICYDIYDKMGAHLTSRDGISGVQFALWAPGAARVSVVGEFNQWNRESHPMEKLGDSGVYRLFVPGLEQGTLYKFAVTSAEGTTVLKADPYGTCTEVRPNNASVVWDVSRYDWTDEDWMTGRSAREWKKEPVSVYQVHLGSWMRQPEGGFCNYRQLARQLAGYAGEMGYTHVELLPIMEHPLDASWGFQTTGYYAPTSRFGTPEDFQYFVDYLHGQGIGVILDWVPSHFPRDEAGLARFDGTCVYEHLDPRQGEYPRWGTLLFNYGRPQVSNFLIANALYWTDRFHVDGIRLSSMAVMLYLDYQKQPGQWIPNLYGGNENLEAVEFLKHLSSVFHKKAGGAMLIAEESEMWAQVTGDLRDGALGFDYKWNLGWSTDFLRYMTAEPAVRSRRYSQMTYSMLYAYSEDFIVGFTHDDVAGEKGSLLDRMWGRTESEKAANLRAAYGYWMTHPGKKMLFMGQDSGQTGGWNEKEGLPEPDERGRSLRAYVSAWNRLYRSCPALYELDFHPDGFQWIDCLNAGENRIAFLRQGRDPGELLLVICNFGPEAYESCRIGVPCPGRWREILCSDRKEFGGGGMTNPCAIRAAGKEQDGRDYSVEIRIAPFSVHVLKWEKEDDR